MKKVSIIIPVYNSGRYLTKCLDSLISQTLEDIEIICINDGSTDNSRQILESYAESDSRIILVNKENEGQSVARNLGIERASGEYISFVDSDDWVDLDYFEKLYSAAKKSDADIATSGFKRAGKYRKSIRKLIKEESLIKNINDKVKLEKIPEHNYVWNKIYKREKFVDSNIKFIPNRFFEDIQVLIQILFKMDTVVTVPNVFYYYFKNPTSTVKQQTKKHKEDYKWAIKELYEFARLHNIQIPLYKNIVKKIKIKLLNLLILKIYYYRDYIEYKLFGFIPLLKIIF